jgi:superoxide dismutase, Cu-Zn family
LALHESAAPLFTVQPRHDMRNVSASLIAAIACMACTPADRMANDTAAVAGGAVRDAGDPTISGSAAGAAMQVAVRDAAGRELGTLSLTESSGGITIQGTLRGLPPGTHGVHLHTVGSCEPPFESAGGHWNPTGRQHGLENAQGPHLGDMQNLEVSADSTATVQLTTTGGTLRGENALLDGDGAAVVVHAGADDHRTDPSGNSGARIACGIIRGS